MDINTKSVDFVRTLLEFEKRLLLLEADSSTLNNGWNEDLIDLICRKVTKAARIDNILNSDYSSVRLLTNLDNYENKNK